MYKRIRILHRTAYYYHQPVTFGPHRAMLRPREGHDVHIVKGLYEIQPKAEVRWLRDVHGNSIAVITFAGPSDKLVVASEVDVEFRTDNPIECLIDPGARCFPFQYAPDEQLELMTYRLPSYPYDGPMLQEWLRELYRPGQTAETFELLGKLNTHIFTSLKYAHRDDAGVQLPHDTLSLGSGSCRDFAVLMMEALRSFGLATRFVTGYLYDDTTGTTRGGGSTHAWCSVYLPGAGWVEYDPTNGLVAGANLIRVGVTRLASQASPVSGSFMGDGGDFEGLDVDVAVTAIPI